MRKIINKLPLIIFILCLLVFIFTCLANFIVIASTNKYINTTVDYNNYKYIIVLGAKVTDSSPSLMLKDRLDKVVELYNQNKDIKIIVSGDSKNPNTYDEVTVMYNYLINNNIDKNNLIKDEYGLSTYESINRAKNIIEQEKTIIITQKYHLYRSLYIAKQLDIEAVGISAKEYKYYGQLTRNIREILARVKDFIQVKLKR